MANDFLTKFRKLVLKLQKLRMEKICYLVSPQVVVLLFSPRHFLGYCPDPRKCPNLSFLFPLGMTILCSFLVSRPSSQFFDDLIILNHSLLALHGWRAIIQDSFKFFDTYVKSS